MRLVALVVLLAGSALVGDLAPSPARAAAPVPCPGDPIVPDVVIEDSFSSSIQGAYVMVPFEVPFGTTQVRVKYCWDRPETGGASHTIDLGLWDARPKNRPWGRPEFRGWGGSSHPDVTITPQGFSSEAEYLARPRGHVPGRTTRGFVPGPLPPGEWAAELGVAAVATQAQGDADGRVAWRVEIALDDDPAFAADRYRRARYDAKPAVRGPGWYAGDFHVHAEHSALGDATMTEAFDYAFRPLAEGGAGLDFITLSDYVTTSHWGEIGRYQALHPGKLVVRSAEVITYHGHANNHASRRYVDHRTGPVYARGPDGTLTWLRGPTPPSALFLDVHKADGFTQINHPRIFPPALFGSACRGCYWEYSNEETNVDRVDAIEIQTGPAAFGATPNPFTIDAIAYWESLLATGRRIAAVGSSDSHRAGRVSNPTQTPIGQATTVVFARNLSERAVRDAVLARRTYVKLLGNAGPDLRLEASARGRRAIIGDVLRAGSASFVAQVLNVVPDEPGLTLHVLKDGATLASVPVTGPTFQHAFEGGPGRWRLQLERGDVVVALTSPIWVES